MEVSPRWTRNGDALPSGPDGHVICYESPKSKEHEINYATHDLKLGVLIHAMKMW
jgi:hypothetical protein